MCESVKGYRARLSAILRTPIITPILRERALAGAITGACVAQVGLFALTGHGWQCPIRAALGIPCPGCGLTHAAMLLFQGKWGESLSEHAFVPIFLLGLVLVAIGSLLPGNWRDKLVNLVSVVEQRTGITALVLIALMGYWGIRLLLAVKV